MQACIKIGEDQSGPAYRCRPVDSDGRVKCTTVGSGRECTSEAPICGPMGICTTCQGFAIPDDACKTATPDRPYCKLSMSGLCVQCTIVGSTSLGCTMAAPVCDAAGKCGECTAHSQCVSGLCRLPEYGLQPRGTCAIGALDVAYVGKTNCLDSGMGSKVQPFCEITPAIASNRPFIVVDAGTYAGFTVSGGTRVLLGKGRDAGTIINGPVISTASAVFWMEGVRLSLPAGAMNVEAAVSCKSASTLTIARSIIEGTPSSIPGISSTSNCGQLNVFSCHIRGNGGLGIEINTGRKYSIANSLIAENDSGIFLGLASQGIFQFNTVRNNNLFGVDCRNSQVLDSSIIVNNGGVGVMAQGMAGCRFMTTHVGSPTDTTTGLVRADPPEFVGAVGAADNSKLKVASVRNGLCCIDQSDNFALKEDYFSSARPKGIKADIGFHEIQ